MACVAYKKGYKYQIVETFTEQIDIRPEQDIDTVYVDLSAAGVLTLKEGYAWDGPSGPTFDTLNFMRGSLVHDALYQLMRMGQLDPEQYREPADRLLQRMCKQDGMSSIRAWWVYQGVHNFGKPAADPANKKPVIKAPESCQAG
jgi:hypothetical protein